MEGQDFGQLGDETKAYLHSPNAVNDTSFWSKSMDSTSTVMPPPSGIFTEEIQIHTLSSPNTAPKVAAGIAGLVLLWFGWCFFINNQTPDVVVTELLATVLGDMSGGPVAEPVAHKEVASAHETALQMQEGAVERPYPKPGQIAKNPYEALENKMTKAPTARLKAISAEQENQYRTGLESPYYYQRYQTVLEIVSKRQEGSEQLLRDALQSGKFWMRMHALIGLADFGYKVSDDDVQMALGDAHSELRARFLERFEPVDKCLEGCLFVVRALMPFGDSSLRMAALRVLAKDTSELSSQYLVAATFDPNETVQQFAAKLLIEKPVSEILWWKTYEQVFKLPGSVQTLGAVERSYEPSEKASTLSPAVEAVAKVERTLPETQLTHAVTQPELAQNKQKSDTLAAVAVQGVVGGKKSLTKSGKSATVDPVTQMWLNLFGGGLVMVMVLVMSVLIVNIAAQFRLFKLAGEPGWAVFVPIYNIVVALKIARLPGWMIVGFLIPGINGILALYLAFHIAKAFGKDSTYCFFYALFQPIMAPILAFSRSTQYAGSIAMHHDAMDRVQSTSQHHDVNDMHQSNMPMFDLNTGVALPAGHRAG